MRPDRMFELSPARFVFALLVLVSSRFISTAGRSRLRRIAAAQLLAAARSLREFTFNWILASRLSNPRPPQ